MSEDTEKHLVEDTEEDAGEYPEEDIGDVKADENVKDVEVDDELLARLSEDSDPEDYMSE